MSIARIYTTKGPVRKDGLKCGRCGDPIVKGVDQRRTFSVGFRGFEQTRCMKAECTPSRSELESTALAEVWDAIDGADIDGASSLDDLYAIRDAISEACQNVASEYDNNEMIEVNYDLQERRDTIESAGSEIEDWEPEDDEPTVEDKDEDQTDEDVELAHDEWLDNAKASLRDAIDSLTFP